MALGRWIAFASVVVIAIATLRPEPGSSDITHLCLICGTFSGVDSVLNLLLFVPLGVGLAVTGMRARIALPAMCSYSLAIEASQLLILAGRHASVGDVVTNSLGGALGFALGHSAALLLRPRPATATRLAASWMGLWLAGQTIVAYSLIPVPARAPYYAQITRPDRRSGFRFPGRVLEATLGGEALTAGQLPNGQRLKALVGQPDGAPLRVNVTSDGISPGRSEIVVISGREQAGVVSLEEEGGDLVFGVRTGADVLLLRSLEFSVRDVFRASMPATASDPVRLYGSYGRRLIVLSATSDSMVRERRFVPRLSYGWLLLSPFEVFIDGNARLLLVSAAYMAVLALPLGFWGGLSGRTERDRQGRRTRRWVVVAGGLAAGLLAIPIAFGLRPAAIWEWGACAAGIAIGVALSRVSPVRSTP